MTDLWSSVFTPGATPTLLLATNVTFGALQLLLLALLIATYSIHFVILSLLCGGLWWSINWFATELQAAQQKEEEAKRIRKVQSPRNGNESTQHDTASPTVGVQGTENEKTSGTIEPLKFVPIGEDKELENRIKDDLRKSGQANMASGASKDSVSEVRQRMTASQVSTDSEWEKVEDER